MSKRLNLLFVKGDFIGYGMLGTRLTEAIKAKGIELFDHLPQPHEVEEGDDGPICSHASWISTPGHARGWWEGQSISILTMWESTRLPEPFRESLDEFELVMVPSEQNVELFSQYHDNVRYVPLGIDPLEWSPLERPDRGQQPFTFLICGGGYRKGVDLVVRAFREVFGDSPAPRLIVKSPRSYETYGPGIEVVPGRLDFDSLRGLYALAHVYVQPSRGEGFGLQPLQAIAQGMPTIATAAHGHMAYKDLITYPLPATPVDTPPQSFHHGPAGSWWEPDFDALCEAMRDAYDRYEELLPEARANGYIAGTTLSWERSAEAWLDAMGDRLDGPDLVIPRGPKTATQRATETWRTDPTRSGPDDLPSAPVWVRPQIRRYRVRVTEPRTFDVGGVVYQMVPGQDYYEPADVKRILYDAGYLDPECVSDADDVGLTPEQYERIPEYTASHSLCHACGQRLNTNMPSDEELIKQLERVPAP